MDKQEVLIIGAGISGLVMARMLCRAGLKVAVIEARDRIGGRILSIRDRGVTLEAGPEFIHGHLKETVSLLNEYRIPFKETAGKMYYARSGRLELYSEENGDWDLLIKKMKGLKKDLPFTEFLMVNFNAEKFRKLRESAIRFAEGFDLADVHKVSSISLIREWEQEESVQYRIPGGYGQLTEAISREFILSGGKIYLNCPVRELQWVRGDVLITASENQKFRAGRVIVTLPVGVLNHAGYADNAVRFSPELADKKIALQQIGFGTVIKMVLLWDTTFWKRFTPDLGFIFSEEDIPTWWTQSPTDSNVLTGWVGGKKAETLSGLPEPELLKIALQNLSAIFGLTQAELNAQLVSAKCFNWKKEIFTGGAYSYTLAGYEKARVTWKLPVEDTLYFAGEACYDGPHGGTVEAAIVSGLETARELLKQYRAT
ncbi:MAG TPA: NAD(P)/FAD-dependent oxidoreductase [Puia sp.]